MLMHCKTALWSLELQAVRIAECERSTSMSVPVRITVLYRRPPAQMHKKENDLHSHHHKAVTFALVTRCMLMHFWHCAVLNCKQITIEDHLQNCLKKENDLSLSDKSTNRGLISENRSTEATLVLTIPRSCLSRLHRIYL